MDITRLYLASQSPRRAQLLTQIGVEFKTLLIDVNEQYRPGETPEDYVRRLAYAKAAAGLAQLTEEAATYPSAVLGADTIVVKDAVILGKPANSEHCKAMLGQLSGGTHEVLTAVAVIVDRGEPAVYKALSQTRVTFKPLSASEVQNYWESGEPADKAGAYAIQGIGAMFVDNIEGSYSGVVGLPLYETSQLLHAVGVPTALSVAKSSSAILQ